ncbi:MULTISPECIES: sensor domain-containing diguanylate cyclase [unclassified Chromohalobacter]|uniref:sensor domain-containing diguanylate cyclase n=1 Tax=unclassified Chromohalobacter TaxID=2628571 RepID=UPI0024691FCD|nr:MULTISPECIES: sensor domain-containing diguanylate cyclase [unclassified Chromohalobacter]
MDISAAKGFSTLPSDCDALLEDSPAILYATGPGWWRNDLHYVSYNLATLIGATRAQLQSTPALWLEHVRDAQEVEARLFAGLAAGKSRIRLYYRIACAEGHVRYMQDDIAVQRDAMGDVIELIGSLADISETQVALTRLEELADSERRYRFIVEHVSDAILLMDADGECRFASPSVRGLLGHRPESLHDCGLLELLPPDDAPRVQRLIHDASRHGKPLRMELRMRHRLGHYVWLETCCSPYLNPASECYEWILAVARDITDRKHREHRLHELSTTDSLTGALNRDAYLNCLRSGLEAADHVSQRVSLVIFDIDHFKTINDTWGHAAGDLVLACVGEICRTALRDHDVFGRIGGEEFSLMLAGQSLNDAALLAERLRKKFESVRVEFHGEWLSFSVSFGVAERQSREGGESLLHRADMGLYAAKHNGRNRVHQAPPQPI